MGRQTSSGPGVLGCCSASAALAFAVFLFDTGEASLGIGGSCAWMLVSYIADDCFRTCLPLWVARPPQSPLQLLQLLSFLEA